MRRLPWFRASVSETVHAPGPLSAQTEALLRSLQDHWLLIRGTGVVRAATGVAGLGVAAGAQMIDPHLRELVQKARAAGHVQDVEFAIGGVSVGAPPRQVRAHGIRIDTEHVLVVLQDISDAGRVHAMRRAFIATVADELRTPTEELLEDARDMERSLRKSRPLTDTANAVEAKARRLSTLISDVTDIARMQASDPMEAATDLSLASVIEQALLDVARAVQDKRQTVVQDVAEARFVANREQVVLAIRNLLTNASAYSGPHTRIGITASRVGAMVQIAVSDEGTGIPAEELEWIFDRFHRVDAAASRDAGGTGLGLTIVRQICAAHGGEVTVDSAPGRGSVFTLRFPARTQDAASSAPGEVS